MVGRWQNRVSQALSISSSGSSSAIKLGITSQWRRGLRYGCNLLASSGLCWWGSSASHSHTLEERKTRFLFCFRWTLKHKKHKGFMTIEAVTFSLWFCYHTALRLKSKISSPTCQGALTLRQVEDFVKSSSLGAVVSPAVLVPADQRSWGADISPTPSCRKLMWWTGRRTGLTNQSEAPGSPLQVKQPLRFTLCAV